MIRTVSIIIGVVCVCSATVTLQTKNGAALVKKVVSETQTFDDFVMWTTGRDGVDKFVVIDQNSAVALEIVTHFVEGKPKEVLLYCSKTQQYINLEPNYTALTLLVRDTTIPEQVQQNVGSLNYALDDGASVDQNKKNTSAGVTVSWGEGTSETANLPYREVTKFGRKPMPGHIILLGSEMQEKQVDTSSKDSVTYKVGGILYNEVQTYMSFAQDKIKESQRPQASDSGHSGASLISIR